MSRRLFAAIATALLSATLLVGAVAATSPVPDEFGATPIAADPTVIDARPHAWDRIIVSSDGRTLDIFFWMGIEECNGLRSVTVTPNDGLGLDIGLMTGQPASMEPDTACIEIAQLYVTTVVLERPLITQPMG